MFIKRTKKEGEEIVEFLNYQYMMWVSRSSAKIYAIERYHLSSEMVNKYLARSAYGNDTE